MPRHAAIQAGRCGSVRMFAVVSRFGQIMPMWLRDLRAQEPELEQP